LFLRFGIFVLFLYVLLLHHSVLFLLCCSSSSFLFSVFIFVLCSCFTFSFSDLVFCICFFPLLVVWFRLGWIRLRPNVGVWRNSGGGVLALGGGCCVRFGGVVRVLFPRQVLMVVWWGFVLTVMRFGGVLLAVGVLATSPDFDLVSSSAVLLRSGRRCVGDLGVL
jgi:hypothetical protein